MDTNRTPAIFTAAEAAAANDNGIGGYFYRGAAYCSACAAVMFAGKERRSAFTPIPFRSDNLTCCSCHNDVAVAADAAGD